MLLLLHSDYQIYRMSIHLQSFGIIERYGPTIASISLRMVE